MLEVLLTAALLTIVTTAVLMPLARGVEDSHADAAQEEMEIAKQAKYREIRDAEIDYKSGKLTDDEWRETDLELRREATAILARMDQGKGRS